MTWLSILLLVGGVGALVALAYWQLIIAEGTYLGPRVVAWTYDLVARHYDGIKQFNPQAESWFIAGPLLRSLGRVKQPLILDVATGTGRLPLALLRERFEGQIVGLDLSQEMLHQAQSKLQPYGDQVQLVWQDARQLPFGARTFDAVCCLESLEFLPKPHDALAEMVRVLAPGGVLFLTNRVGPEARLLPGRTIPRQTFAEVLASHPLRDVVVRPWQTNYDLVMAHREGYLGSKGRGATDLASLLFCPGCGGRLEHAADRLLCRSCKLTYRIDDGIVCLAASRR